MLIVNIDFELDPDLKLVNLDCDWVVWTANIYCVRGTDTMHCETRYIILLSVTVQCTFLLRNFMLNFQLLVHNSDIYVSRL